MGSPALPGRWNPSIARSARCKAEAWWDDCKSNSSTGVFPLKIERSLSRVLCLVYGGAWRISWIAKIPSVGANGYHVNGTFWCSDYHPGLRVHDLHRHANTGLHLSCFACGLAECQALWSLYPHWDEWERLILRNNPPVLCNSPNHGSVPLINCFRTPVTNHFASRR